MEDMIQCSPRLRRVIETVTIAVSVRSFCMPLRLPWKSSRERPRTHIHVLDKSRPSSTIAYLWKSKQQIAVGKPCIKGTY